MSNGWTPQEWAIRDAMEADPDLAVAVNMRTMPGLIWWSFQVGRYTRVDRRTPWGNPFRIGADGDRAEVIRKFEQRVLPLLDVTVLRGQALGCWCAPLPCHADVLARAVRQQVC